MLFWPHIIPFYNLKIKIMLNFFLKLTVVFTYKVVLNYYVYILHYNLAMLYTLKNPYQYYIVAHYFSIALAFQFPHKDLPI